MFYSFYLFLSISLCNVNSAFVSDSNAYVWISNCTEMFELYSNVRIYIRILKECGFSACSRTMASSDYVGKKIPQLHQELANAYKKRFMCEDGQVAVAKCSPTWINIRKNFKTFPEIKSQVHSQIEAWKQKLSLLRMVKALFYLDGKIIQGKVSEFQKMRLIPVTNILSELSSLRLELM